MERGSWSAASLIAGCVLWILTGSTVFLIAGVIGAVAIMFVGQL